MIFKIRKDGGLDSNVTGYWLVEFKNVFSIVLLKFENGSRDAFHSHAFNCFSWLLKGMLVEKHYDETTNDIIKTNIIVPSLKPFMTYKDTFHQVTSVNTSWVLNFRGPWDKTWKEYIPKTDKLINLESGRKVLDV